MKSKNRPIKEQKNLEYFVCERVCQITKQKEVGERKKQMAKMEK